MKRAFLAFYLLLSLSTFTYAQDDADPWIVHTAMPSLTIVPDARAGGMGDVGVATTPDANSQFWNPSKYVFMESEAGASMAFTPWLSQLVNDINLGYVSGYWKFAEQQALSASLRYFSLGEITLTNDAGNEIQNVNPNEFSVDAAYSRLLSEKLSASVALRFIYSDLNNGVNSAGGTDMYPGIAVASDVSAYYKTPITMETGDANLAFGFNASNIGSKMSYDKGTTEYFIPTNLRIGGSFEYPIDEYNKISFSADANKLLVPTPSANKDLSTVSSIAGIFQSFSDAPGGAKEELSEVMWSVGAEYAYNKQFFVRSGYYHESQTKGNRKYFTAGAGFKLNVFQLDAGYVISTSQTNPLDKTLRFTLTFDLFGLQNLVK